MARSDFYAENQPAMQAQTTGMREYDDTALDFFQEIALSEVRYALAPEVTTVWEATELVAHGGSEYVGNGDLIARIRGKVL